MGSARSPSDVTIAMTQNRSALRNLVASQSAPGGSPVVWLDGTDTNLTGNSGLNDGDPIAPWKNKGSGGATYDPTQATGGLKPLLRTSRINGLSCVEYSSTAYLRNATANPNGTNAARHLFFVVTTPASAKFLWINNESGFAVRMGGASGLQTFWTDSAGTTVTCNAGPAAGTNVIVEVSFDGNVAHLPTCRINGVDQVVAQNTGSGAGNETQTNTFYAGYQFSQVIGEMIDYTAVQDAGTAAATRSYLTNKWAISA